MIHFIKYREVRNFGMIKNLKFKYIEAGEFHFGTEWNKEKFINMVNNYNVPLEWLLKEVPQKKVYLNDYWISETPVTIGMMKEFYQNNPHVQMPLVIKKHINNNDLDFPAYHINFEDALMFCYWASETLGECIDLPTEPEWEKAARGSWDDREFPWGDEIIENVNIKGQYNSLPIPVKNIKENRSPYGVYDLSGNIEEWTRSYNRPYLGSPLKYSKSLNYHILRGGTCEHGVDLARCSRRHGNIPSVFRGFRIVKRKEVNIFQNDIYSEYSEVNEGDFILARTSKLDQQNLIVDIDLNKKAYLDIQTCQSNEIKLFKGFSNPGSEILVQFEGDVGGQLKVRKPSLSELDSLLRT